MYLNITRTAVELGQDSPEINESEQSKTPLQNNVGEKVGKYSSNLSKITVTRNMKGNPKSYSYVINW
jgi:hypothetical protein